MRILILTQFFPPEIGAAQRRLWEIARRLADLGDEVEILTGLPNYPAGVVPPPYRGRVFVREMRDGIRVNRTWLIPASNRGAAKRIVNHASFALSAILAATVCARPDVLLVESPPLLVAIAGWLVSRLKRVPLLLSVSDLFTESAVALEIIRNPMLTSISSRLEGFVYRRAAGIVALTEGVRTGILRSGAAEAKVRVIHGCADAGRFGSADGSEWRSRHGLGDAFIALYAGTFASSQSLSTLVEAGQFLQSHLNIRIVLVGDGGKRVELERSAAGSKTVLVVPSVTSDEMPSVLAAANICLVPIRSIRFLSGMIPGKMFEAMAAGKAVVLAAPPGEASHIIEAGKCGVVVPPESPQLLAQAIERLASDPAALRVFGMAGRRLAEGEFSCETMVQRIRSLVHEYEVAEPLK